MSDDLKHVKMPENGASSGKRAAKAAASLVLAGCLLSSLALNIYQANQANAQNKRVNKFIDNQLERQAKEEEKENTYQEDGYIVGDEYEIISTAHISDAYINKDADKLEKEDQRTLKMASDILKDIIKEDMGNYEKELAVYRWMYENVGQGSGSMISLPGAQVQAYTPYGVLTGGSAVCVGYATTFRLFMNMLGIDCHIVHNDYHSWDLVQLDDGEWYHVDVYTDVSGKTEYRNFNMTDDVSRNSHDWDESALPAAVGVKYSYAVQSGIELEDIYHVPAKFKKALDKKHTFGFYKFKKPLKKEELDLADLMLGQISVAVNATPGFENYSISGNWYLDEKDQYILGIFAMNYDDIDDNGFDVDSPEGKKVTNAVAKAFDVDKQMLGELSGSMDAMDGESSKEVELD